MALLLAVAEIFARHRRTVVQARFTDAMLVGLAQVGALIPGVSRSCSTLTAAVALGFKRDEAARLRQDKDITAGIPPRSGGWRGGND
jgi:undecaprenyl-diphosphatase